MTSKNIVPFTAWEGDEGPFGELQRSMNRLFRDFSRSFDRDWPKGALSLAAEGNGRFLPDIDISEDENQLQVSAEMPGMDPKNFSIELKDKILTLKGEKKSESEEKKKDYYRSERHFGAFQRSFVLPCEVDGEKVQANYKDGVLKITLPKSPEAKKLTRTIQVRTT